MEMIFIALVDTPGFFASMIRKVTGLQYVHVALALDSRLNEAYSIGRRQPCIPFFAGFEREDKRKIVRAFPTARYQISCVPCTGAQKEAITKELRACYAKRYSYHYCLLGLPFILLQKPFYQKNHYTCTSFASKILEKYAVLSFDKHFSLVTPRDFYEAEGKTILFEGRLEELVADERRLSNFTETAYET